MGGADLWYYSRIMAGLVKLGAAFAVLLLAAAIAGPVATFAAEDATPDLPLGATSPEVSRLRAFATEPPTGTEAILLKQPGRVTEDEMLSLIRDPGYRTRASALPEAVRRWHVNFFGTGLVPRDVTGRQIDAPPIRPIPTVPTRPIAADGYDLVAGIGRIVALVARGGKQRAVATGHAAANDA